MLPVVLMACITFRSLRRDRILAEKTTRLGVVETADRLASDLGSLAGARLMYATLRSRQEQQMTFAAAHWLLENQELQREALSAQPILAGDSRWWRGSSPGVALAGSVWVRDPKIPPDLLFSADGALVDPADAAWNPRPPAWLGELNPQQAALWSELSTLPARGAGSDQLKPVCDRFMALSPPEPARAAAEWLCLRAAAATESPEQARDSFLSFAERCGGNDSTNGWKGAVSEAGLPLSTLATLEALRVPAEPKFTADQWHALIREVWSFPGLLTPSLLEVAAARDSINSRHSGELEALQRRYAYQEEQRKLGALIRSSVSFPPAGTNCFWMSTGDRWFLCCLRPADELEPTAGSNHLVAAYVFSETDVATAFCWALENAQPRPGNSLAIFVELEGRDVPLCAPWLRSTNFIRPKDLLASAVGKLNCFATVPRGTNAPGRMPQIFEVFPGNADFRLRLYLSNPEQFYARQRQRALLFTGMMAASGVAALAGLLAAWRAFRRQLELNEIKSNFVSSVSHELRAPIAAVRLMAENLEGGKITEPPKQKEYFGFIVQECRRLSSLIENVLDFSRIEQGRKQYEFEPTDLLALVRGTVTLMEPYAAEKGVTLELSSVACSSRGDEAQTSNQSESPHVDSYELNVDGKAIQQALINLIDNAVKHSARGQTVTVEIELTEPGEQNDRNKSEDDGRGRGRGRVGATCNLQPATCNLSVSDHGPGIPAEEQEKIFERFYRLGSELRRETQGVGIGLSIVKHIVEAHGGRVTVRSAPGEGSRFTIKLPQTISTTDGHG
ncbi:MAG: HAMP domain-containing sensor histidine kinase [Verrucomicrobiota bacterium]